MHLYIHMLKIGCAPSFYACVQIYMCAYYMYTYNFIDFSSVHVHESFLWLIHIGCEASHDTCAQNSRDSGASACWKTGAGWGKDTFGRVCV